MVVLNKHLLGSLPNTHRRFTKPTNRTEWAIILGQPKWRQYRISNCLSVRSVILLRENNEYAKHFDKMTSIHTGIIFFFIINNVKDETKLTFNIFWTTLLKYITVYSGCLFKTKKPKISSKQTFLVTQHLSRFIMFSFNGMRKTQSLMCEWIYLLICINFRLKIFE